MEKDKINDDNVDNIENNPAHPIEHDYEEHKNNPGLAPTAISEDNDKGVGYTIIWVIATIVIILTLIWFFFFRDVA